MAIIPTLNISTQDEEIARAVKWITEQNEQGIPWSEIAILSPSTHILSNSLSSVLESKNIPFNLIVSSADKSLDARTRAYFCYAITQQ